MSRPVDYAYEYIKEKILNGSFLPSQRLTEMDLADTIGASRNTIKKALLTLEKENLIEIQKNKGAIVKSFTLDEILNYLEVRKVLEGLIARSATQNISDDDLVKLQDILTRMKQHLKRNEYDEYSSLNKIFHQVIYEASKNPQAVEIINSIKTQLARYHIRTILIPGRNKNSYHEHLRILEALKNRNEDEAETALINHIENVRDTIHQHFSLLI